MKKMIPSLGILFLLVPGVLLAQSPNDLCRQEITKRLTEAQDEFRHVVYGSSGSTIKTRDPKTGKPTDEPLLGKGITMLKTGTAFTGSDLIGILETKKRLTSELVTPLTESYRALRCHMRAICAGVDFALNGGANSNFTNFQPLGCEPIDISSVARCTFAENAYIDKNELSLFCTTTVDRALEIEKASLKMAVAYDAGYRSVLQIAGMLDRFVDDLPTRVFSPLRDMIALLGKLHTIPCFIGQCDGPPSP